MASKSSSCRATLVIGLGSCSCKAAVFAPPTFRSNSESDELGAPEKSIPAFSYANATIPVEPILALKYSEADLMRILKIFLETKSQEPKAEVPCKQLLKAKVPNKYFGKSHMDC